nr:MAG TPA: hypothetical protein [Caudoviricetes sp.]
MRKSACVGRRIGYNAHMPTGNSPKAKNHNKPNQTKPEQI